MANKDVLSKCEALASEAEGVILGSLVAAAGRLHPAGGGHTRQAAGRLEEAVEAGSG